MQTQTLLTGTEVVQSVYEKFKRLLMEGNFEERNFPYHQSSREDWLYGTDEPFDQFVDLQVGLRKEYGRTYFIAFGENVRDSRPEHDPGIRSVLLYGVVPEGISQRLSVKVSEILGPLKRYGELRAVGPDPTLLEFYGIERIGKKARAERIPKTFKVDSLGPRYLDSLPDAICMMIETDMRDGESPYPTQSISAGMGAIRKGL